MKFIRMLLLFLVLGMLANWAVTWFIAARLHHYSHLIYMHYSAASGPAWIHQMGRSGWGSTAIWGDATYSDAARPPSEFNPALPTWSRMQHPPSPRDWRGSSFSVTAHGWPCLSMTETSLYGLGPPYIVVDGIDLGGGRALPGRVIPAGFAINSGFYAVFLWVLVRGKRSYRLTMRRRRGQCLKCAYDLRHADHDACPECGTAVATGGQA